MYNSIGVDFHLFLYFQRNEQILDLVKMCLQVMSWKIFSTMKLI